jgi:hypothetical protein
MALQNFSGAQLRFGLRSQREDPRAPTCNANKGQMAFIFQLLRPSPQRSGQLPFCRNHSVHVSPASASTKVDYDR